MTALPADWRLPHGGDLGVAASLYDRPFADLSTGLNPHPYPVPPIAAAAWARLPQSAAEDDLLEAARGAYGLPKGMGIIAAPGTQALLQWLPLLDWPPGPVAVVTPTYAEHAHLWRKSGRDVVAVDHPADLPDAIIVVVGQPNNPDGRRWPIPDLLAIHALLARRGGSLIIDEAFADAEPDCSLVSHLDPEGPLILRSFGKFYGLGGVRLGFALGPAKWTGALAARLGPWSVSGPAIALGTTALADRAWQVQTRILLGEESAVLAETLHRAGATA